MLSKTSSKIINLGLYQLGWFSCLLGAAWGYPNSGALVALGLMAVHLALAASRKTESILMVSACLLGIVVDTSHQVLGVLTFKADPAWPLWLPLWIVIIWAQFATLFHYGLYWLSGRYLLSALFGFIGGPFAYWGGVRLGAAQFNADPIFSVATLALVWALVLPMFVWMSGRLDRREGQYRSFSTDLFDS